MKKPFLVFFLFYLLASFSTAQESLYYVSNQKYCKLLNVVAREDLHELYTPALVNNGIIRSGSPGFYHYTVIDNKEEEPVTSIPWASAARCANWLEWLKNSSQDSESTFLKTWDAITEEGVYTLNESNQCIEINTNATYLLPSNTNEVSFANFPDIGSWGSPDLDHPEMASILREGMPMAQIDAALGLTTIGVRFKAEIYQGILPPLNPQEWTTTDYFKVAGGLAVALLVGHGVRKAHECWEDRNTAQGIDLTEKEVEKMNEKTPGEKDPFQREQTNEEEEEIQRQDKEKLKEYIEEGDVHGDEVEEAEKVIQEEITDEQREIDYSEKEKRKCIEELKQVQQRLEELNKNTNLQERDRVEEEKRSLLEEKRDLESDLARLNYNEKSKEEQLKHLEEEERKLNARSTRISKKEQNDELKVTPAPVDIPIATPSATPPSSAKQQHSLFIPSASSNLNNIEKESRSSVSSTSGLLSHEETVSLAKLEERLRNRQPKIVQQIQESNSLLLGLKKELLLQAEYEKGITLKQKDSAYVALQSIFEQVQQNVEIIHDCYKDLLDVKKKLIQLNSNALDFEKNNLDSELQALNSKFEEMRKRFKEAQGTIKKLEEKISPIVNNPHGLRREVQVFEKTKKQEHLSIKNKITEKTSQRTKLPKDWSHWYQRHQLQNEISKLKNEEKDLEQDLQKIGEREQERLLISHTFHGTPEEGLTPAKKGITEVLDSSYKNFLNSHAWLEKEAFPIIEDNYKTVCRLVHQLNIHLEEVPETALAHPQRLLRKIEEAHEKVLDELVTFEEARKQAFELADAIGTKDYDAKLQELQQLDRELAQKIEHRTKELEKELKEAMDISNSYCHRLTKVANEYEQAGEKSKKKHQKIEEFKEVLQGGTEID